MSKVIDKAKKLIKIVRKGSLDSNGSEVLDPRPVGIPVGFQKPPSLTEMMQKYVRHELSRRAEADGMESFEEAEDFDVSDEDEWLESDWELVFDPSLKREVNKYEAAYLEAHRKQFDDLLAEEKRKPKKKKKEDGHTASPQDDQGES